MAPRKVSKKTRGELVRMIDEQYQASSQSEKRRILDEFVVVTGYHHNHAIRLLNKAGSLVSPRKASQSSVYCDFILIL